MNRYHHTIIFAGTLTPDTCTARPLGSTPKRRGAYAVGSWHRDNRPVCCIIGQLGFAFDGKRLWVRVVGGGGD